MGGTAPLALAGIGLMKSTLDTKQTNNQASYDYQQRVADLQRQKKADEKKRLSALEEISATQRARFAAQGLNPASGSSGAVLSGLQDKTQQELDAQSQKYATSVMRAQQTFSDIQTANLEKKVSATNLLLNDISMLNQLKNWS